MKPKPEVKTAPNTHPDDGGPEEIAYENQQPAPVTAKCPYCRADFKEIAFLRNDEIGLLTFYHNVPACGKVISIQAVPIQQRIIPPNGILPRNN